MFLDYYEILQISPNADQETVHRIYRVQAQRFHPDNLESGNAEKFRLISDAYRILSDPETRASYDAEYRRTQRRPVPEPAEPSRPVPTVMDETQRREEIIMLLYKRRLAYPDQPSLGLRDLETLLETTRERLEFSLWYLKESGYLARSDSARHTITIKGVQLAESMKARPETRAQLDA